MQSIKDRKDFKGDQSDEQELDEEKYQKNDEIINEKQHKFNNGQLSSQKNLGYVLIQAKDQEYQEVQKDDFQRSYCCNNMVIFGILMILAQIGVCLIYGFKIQTKIYFSNPQPSPPSTNRLPSQLFTSYCFSPFILNIAMSFIAMVGFGLLFAYHRKLVWSALGFNAVIVCLTIEFYFIANRLLYQFSSPLPTETDKYWKIFLSSNIQNQCNLKFNTNFFYGKLFGNTLVGAFKCGIANSIAFSSILGQVGLLEAYIVSLGGVIIYQFSILTSQQLGANASQALSVFIYGGFMGLGLGVIQFMYHRKRQLNETKCNQLYTGSTQSVGFSLIGCVILMAFLPVFNVDGAFSQQPVFQGSRHVNPLNVLYSMSASSIMSFAFSSILNVRINIRDFINGILSGAIAAICASFFINSVISSLIVGSTAGIIQVLVQNFFQKKFARNYNILNTYSFCLFGIQGFIGSIYAQIFRAAFGQYALVQASVPLLMGLKSLGLGFGTGIVIGLLIRLINHYTKGEHYKRGHFNDSLYWIDKEQDVNIRTIFQWEPKKTVIKPPNPLPWL